MKHEIQAVKPSPTLDYVVTDAATGAPMRVTILSGAVAIKVASNFVIGDPASQLGFFVPGAPAFPPGVQPLIVAEMALSQVQLHFFSNTTHHEGVGTVEAQVVTDPQSGQTAVYLSFAAICAAMMVLRYRVTIYRPR